MQTSLQKQKKVLEKKEVAKTSNQAPMQQLFSRPNFWFFFLLFPLSNVVETFFLTKKKTSALQDIKTLKKLVLQFFKVSTVQSFPCKDSVFNC